MRAKYLISHASERMPKIATLSQGKTTVFTGFGPQKNNFRTLFFGLFFPELLHFFFPRGGRQEHIKHTQKIHTINHAVSTFIRFHSKREREDESDDAEKKRAALVILSSLARARGFLRAYRFLVLVNYLSLCISHARWTTASVFFQYTRVTTTRCSHH